MLKEGTYDEGVHRQNTQFPVSLVLTLGTGSRPRKRDLAKGLLAKQRHIKRLISMAKQFIHESTSSRHTEMHMESEANSHKFKYWKWSGGAMLGTLSLDDCKDHTFRLMEEWVQNYINQSNIQEELRQCAELLVQKRRERLTQTPDRWRRFAFCTHIKCLICPRDDLGTREEAKQHIMTDHPKKAENKPIEEVLDILHEIPPWTLRGPF